MAALLFLSFQIYAFSPYHVDSSSGYVQCFGDLTKVYWQWVTNRVNQQIIFGYNKSDDIGPVLWTQSPSDSATQYDVLSEVYFSPDIINQHRNLQLDLIHVNSEWNHALQHNFAVWPLSITADWVNLYDPSILKFSTLHSKGSIDNDGPDLIPEFISKPDWIDFPILFYNSELLDEYLINISSITSWQSLFEVASRIQQCMHSSLEMK